MSDFAKRFLRSFGLEIRRLKPIPMKGYVVHYMHIGKTAGTQIGNVIRQVNQSQSAVTIVKNGHGVTLRDLPEKDDYFFSLRNPVARFRSGFYSRKRMGRPKYDLPWSPSEERLFTEFEHANDLAEALFRTDARGRAAMSAMTTVGHIGAGQVDWFKKSYDIFNLRTPLWIVRQEHLETDLATLMHRLGIAMDFALTDDPVRAHMNDYTGTPPMSELAIANILRWHSADYQFYAHCEAWMTEEAARAAIG